MLVAMSGLICNIIGLPWFACIILLLLTVMLIIPVILFLLIYATLIVMYIYKHRREYSLGLKDADKPKWKKLLYTIAMVWDIHGKIWHGLEFEGFENIPSRGPALIVYYHGALPIDHFYLMTKTLLHKKRFINSVGDYFLFMLPGSKQLMRELKVLTGPVEECVRILESGNILSISPGGVREALFGDEQYKLIWNNRIGFAKVATEAKVPIIPVFCENIRQAFVAVKFCRCFFKPIYEWTKLPFVPFYGGFPVKLKIYIGEPIPYDESVTPEQLALKSKQAIELLIKRHQTIPKSVWQAFLDRFS